jgi:C-terminal processing protease CtpA/Prc
LRSLATIIFLFLTTVISAQTKYQKDFAEFWTVVQKNHAYLEKQKIDWDKVRSIYQPVADTVQNKKDFIRLLEQVINELHNGHVSLNINLPASNRIIPSGADMFVEKIGNTYKITDIRKGYPAENSGLKPGTQVLKFNGRSIDDQIKPFLPKYTSRHNDKMYEYAIAMLFAGTHDKAREITVLENGSERTYYPDRNPRKEANELLEYKILDGNTGYIKINNSLGNNELIPRFDLILDSLIHTRALILDLTETSGGGNTAVARAIMGRFIEQDLPYQKHEVNETEFKIRRSWVEYVSSRKQTYKNKLLVMVGHWTGSMGEGMAIGFDGMKRAELIGTRMAGLLGAVDGFQTTEMKIGFQIPTERLYSVNGVPREDFVPKILTGNIYETWKVANERINIGK